MGKSQRIRTPQDELTYQIIGLAMAIHNEVGPGFLEEIYQRAMAVGLHADGVPYDLEYPICISSVASPSDHSSWTLWSHER